MPGVIQKGFQIICGIPHELVESLGCDDNLVQSVQIVFTAGRPAKMTVECIPGARRSPVVKMLEQYDFVAVKRGE